MGESEWLAYKNSRVIELLAVPALRRLDRRHGADRFRGFQSGLDSQNGQREARRLRGVQVPALRAAAVGVAGRDLRRRARRRARARR